MTRVWGVLGVFALRGLAVLALIAAIPVSTIAQQLPATGTATPLVFDSATVVDVEHGVLVPGQRVVVVGNRIQAVGSVKAVTSPTGARVVDARRKYLIPGLWDMHAHVFRHF